MDLENETSADRFRRAFVETSAKLSFQRRQLAYVQSTRGAVAILAELGRLPAEGLVSPVALQRAIAVAIERHRLAMLAEQD